MVKKLSKVLCGALCGVLFLAGVPAYALGDSNNETSANTPKDEVIYANLDNKGSVKDLKL